MGQEQRKYVREVLPIFLFFLVHKSSAPFFVQFLRQLDDLLAQGNVIQTLLQLLDHLPEFLAGGFGIDIRHRQGQQHQAK